MKPLPIPGQHNSKSRFAETPSAFQHRIEYGGEVAGPTVDDLQYLCGRGLLLQRPSRVSVSSRAFSIAITACAAKFCNSAICLSENGRTSLRAAEIRPRSASSLRSGTNRTVRMPAISAAARNTGWSISAQLAIWAKRLPSISARIDGEQEER
jgi:hypothetical protein